MLAQIEPARNDFHALASYLVHGKERPTHPDRVAWVFGHNLPTDDAALAADYMRATAELSRRCTNACYHMTINWNPDEQPEPETMQEIARRTLDMAGLAAHQALVMGHGDKPHAHLHIMLNRVHPVTGRAWSTSHDYRRFDRIMKQLSEEFGFLYVPPHAFEPELTDDLPQHPDSNATYAARRGAPTDRMQWSNAAARDLGAHLSEAIDRATTWDDLDAAVAVHGLALEPKGEGFVVGDAAGYAKLSRLGLQITAKGLQNRFGARRPAARVRRPRWDATRIASEGERLRAVILAARGWADVEAMLAVTGYGLARVGNGTLITDATSQVSLSALGLSRARLENTFNAAPRLIRPPAQRRVHRPRRETPAPKPRRPPSRTRASNTKPARNVFAVNAVDIARAIGSKDDLKQALGDALRQRKARLATAPLMTQLMEDLKEYWRTSTVLSARRTPKRPTRKRQKPSTRARGRRYRHAGR